MKTFEFTEEQIEMIVDALCRNRTFWASQNDWEEVQKIKTLMNWIKQA